MKTTRTTEDEGVQKSAKVEHPGPSAAAERQAETAAQSTGPVPSPASASLPAPTNPDADQLRERSGRAVSHAPQNRKPRVWIRQQDTGAITEVDAAEFKKDPERFKEYVQCQPDGTPIPGVAQGR